MRHTGLQSRGAAQRPVRIQAAETWEVPRGDVPQSVALLNRYVLVPAVISSDEGTGRAVAGHKAFGFIHSISRRVTRLRPLRDWQLALAALLGVFLWISVVG